MAVASAGPYANHLSLTPNRQKLFTGWMHFLTPSNKVTSDYAPWFTAGGAIRIGHCDVIDDVITRKL